MMVQRGHGHDMDVLRRLTADRSRSSRLWSVIIKTSTARAPCWSTD